MAQNGGSGSSVADTIAQLDKIQAPSQGWKDDTERFALKEAARRLLHRLETPFERIWALAFESPPLMAGLQLLADLGVWSKWRAIHEKTGGAPQTLDSIVGMCDKKAEPNLLRRFLRHLAAQLIISETAVDTYTLLPFGLAMGDESTYVSSGVQCGLDHTIPCGTNLAKFLAKNSYVEPLDKTKSDNYMDLFGSDFFAYCQEHTGAGGSFIGLMTALRNYKLPWTEVYPTSRLLSDDSVPVDLSSPVFVDVGGAHGLDTARLLARHPDLPAKTLFLEDLPAVVSDHAMETLDPRIERVAYDFFTPQPILGSRTYFLHAVPHDWPDQDCLKIFGRIRDAMKRGYSKLLIYEVVLPEKGASSMMTSLDLELMNCTSGLERTEGMWRELLGQSGLEVKGIWRHERAVESVMEVERVD